MEPHGSPDPWVAERIQLVAPDALRPYAANPRTHSEEQVARIAASIIERGFTNPILVDSEGGVIAGHGRLLAAKKLGLEHVPVIELGHLSPAQRRALVIADNKLALDAGWDEPLLQAELRALEADGLTLASAGFSDGELAEMEARLFAPPEHDGDLGGSPGLGTPVISFTIIFDDQEQQDYWFAFVRWLKGVPSAPDATVASRLIAYLQAVSDTRRQR